jgi:hypothetical protein
MFGLSKFSLFNKNKSIGIRRYEMLRHTKFYQFPRQNFGQEMTPHQIHWGIQETLEDQGVADITEYYPSIINHWSKVPIGEGGQEKNTSDYCAFEGAIKGSRGEPVPVWLKVVAFLFPFLGFTLAQSAESPLVLVLFGLLWLASLYGIWYWKKFRRGDVCMLYRGIYLQPLEASSQNSWTFSVDIMLSVNIMKPIGKPLVEPVYQAITNNLLTEIKSTGNAKILPELISMVPDELERRFPIHSEESES